MKLKITLKTISTILVYIAFFSLKANATTHTVNVQNFQFSPANISNVVVGDVVKWVWIEGAHTTTSTSIPAGADPWDSPMTAGNQTFQITVTAAGLYSYQCTPHAEFGMVASFTASAAAPVTLSTFKIANENKNALLKWITVTEENVDYFSVQKSKTGADFVEIAKVPAAGNSSSVRSYSYTDNNLSSADKFYYYMLVTIDKNGNKQFSSVQLFRNKESIPKLILSVSPNPVSRSGHLMLKFNADKAGKMDVDVINMQGTTMIRTAMQANEGVNNGHLMLDGIAAGTYSIVFKLDGIKEVHKLLVK